MENIEDNVILDIEDLIGSKIETKPKPEPDIGVENKHSVANEILKVDNVGDINTTALNNFIEVTRTRNNQYKIVDEMCQDSIPAAILEAYVENITAPNDNNQIVWATSDNAETAKKVNQLLTAFQIDKNIHKWASSFTKYGDLYVRLYKHSEYEMDPVFDTEETEEDKKKKKSLNESILQEDINLNLTSDKDHFVTYAEMVDNPATMFELMRFGKTAGFIQTPDDAQPDYLDPLKTQTYAYQYSFKKKDINVYKQNQFVHASLDTSVDRISEEVKIILDDNTTDDNDTNNSVTYKVKSGQSAFYNNFRIWRELSLLESSLITSRVTRAGLTTILQIETGNIAKEETAQILQSLKQMVEQKLAVNPGNSVAEYNNPGPVINYVYMAKHDGKGEITPINIGGDYDPKTLTDLDYFKNKYYGSFGIPKQWFGDTDDGAGFNGGQSLSIISSQFAKKVLKIQAALTQMIKTMINIVLIDRGDNECVNDFAIHMQTPITQEELDRRESNQNKIGVVGDVMNLLSDMQDTGRKLKILKILLSPILEDSDITDVIEQEIEVLEGGEEKPLENNNESGGFGGRPIGRRSVENEPSSSEDEIGLNLDQALDLGNEFETEETPTEETNNDRLPTPGETGVDLINNVEEI